jgi:hypothetical protein
VLATVNANTKEARGAVPAALKISGQGRVFASIIRPRTVLARGLASAELHMCAQSRRYLRFI